MNELTIKRIRKATAAMLRAHDPSFRQYWAGVVQKLQEKIIH